MELVAESAPSEEAPRAADQLARARAAEHEGRPAFPDEPVDLVQKRRELLDLVDDDRLPRRGSRGQELLAKQRGPPDQPLELLGQEKIVAA